MIINVSKSLLLLCCLAFLMGSCTALQPINRSEKPSYTRKSSPSTSSSLRKNVANYAKKWKGVKYKYGGKDPKGFDCSGFTSYVYRKFDVQVTPSSKVQAKTGHKVALSRARTGDLVFFSKTGRGAVSHVALVVSNQKNEGLVVIHSTSSKGVIVQNISKSSYWKPKMLFARNVLD